MDVLHSPSAVGLARELRRVLDGEHPGPLAVLADPSRAAAVARPLDGVDIVLSTSGSTDGTGRLVGLSLAALIASATATHARLGGAGQWLDTLPTDHAAGFQLAFRSALAGCEPLPVPRWDDADDLRAALGSARPGVPVYASFVPAQLRRLLDSAPDLLAQIDAILIGGAMVPAPLLERAQEAGVRIARTYGMTETCGGCVYDGVPLDGVRVRIEDGLAQIAGGVLMSGYLDGAAQPFIEDGDTRWLMTADLAEWREDGRLSILGRADDVIISGGVNVAPRSIEECLEAAFGGAWAVIGVPDEQWGQRVVAATETPGITLDAVRAATAHLEPASRPRQIAVGPLPRTGLGKLDRRTLRATLEGLSREN